MYLKSSSVSRHRRFLAAGMVCLFVLVATPLVGELVILAGGDVLKVVDFELKGRRMHLWLPSGGKLVLALERIERVVDDEIVPEWERPPAPPPETPFRLGFAATQPVPDTPFGALLFAAARRHDLNPDLLVAMIRAESGFDPQALSPKGARGLLQLMPATARRFGVDVSDLYDPASNLEAAGRYLRWLKGRFDGDLEKMLAAYNAGEGVVERYGGVPPYRETQRYVRRIFADLGLDGDG